MYRCGAMKARGAAPAPAGANTLFGRYALEISIHSPLGLRPSIVGTRTVGRVRAGITERERFPHMPIWLAPVDDASTVLGVDLHVDWAMRCAPVLDAHGLQTRNQCPEFGVTHAEAVMLKGNSIFDLIHVERQPLVDVHRAEGTDTALCPRHSKNACEQFCCRPSIS